MDVECQAVCPCMTPDVPFVNWGLSGCPKPGAQWDEATAVDGCTLQCAAGTQYIPLQCMDGVVKPVDSEVNSCLPAQWEPDDGPCSASCGGGTLTRNWYCASENQRDEDCESALRPGSSVEVCATNHCYGSAREKHANKRARGGAARSHSLNTCTGSM